MSRTCLLDRILQPDGVSVLFQPIIDVSNGGWRLHSVECLARGPKGTNVETAPLLFEYARRKRAENLIDRACVAQAMRHARFLPAGLSFSVNVHASTLGRERDFAFFLEELALQHDLELSRVTVEIVEHLPYWDETGFLHTLNSLRSLGVKIALDDIGMGHSNYRMMLDVRPDYFKIDRYLVEGSHRHYYRQVIIESIVNLAGKFDADVVAEGITNYQDLNLVRGFGLHLIQGYLFAKAMTACEVSHLQAPSSFAYSQHLDFPVTAVA